jgi:non-ribosomal peptide synthase protein (TIGR01720 family)
VKGGRLAVGLSCSARLFRRATAQALADSLINNLRLLIEHCTSPGEGAYTPSDFDALDLSEEDLSAILDDVAGGLSPEP